MSKGRLLARLIFISLLIILVPIALILNKSEFQIINVHDHMQVFQDASRILPIMEKTSISKIILLGSPLQTFFPGRIKNQAFDKYDENNEVILRIAAVYPDKFIAFCVMHQDDKKILEKTKNCIDRGGKGVKLFSGHGSFYTKPLNDNSLMNFYGYLEQNQIPLIWHVNSNKYLVEFEDVLKKFPALRVNCAHFCLSTKSPNRLKHLLETYPNLMFDTSFGGPKIIEDGFNTLSKSKEFFREIFEKYNDRFLFGTDYVLTKIKTEKGILNNFTANRAILEKKSFYYEGKKYDGLNLKKEILRKIYILNPRKFLGT